MKEVIDRLQERGYCEGAATIRDASFKIELGIFKDPYSAEDINNILDLYSVAGHWTISPEQEVKIYPKSIEDLDTPTVSIYVEGSYNVHDLAEDVETIIEETKARLRYRNII